MQPSRLTRTTLAFALLGVFASTARAQCPEEPPLQYWSGTVNTVCPCFVAGEEMGTVFDNIPASHYPIQILRVGFGWGSTGCQFGVPAPDQLENAIVIYNANLASLPAASPVATLSGPVMQDCGINEFDLEAQVPGAITINNGPVTVTLRFDQDSAPLTGPAPGYDNTGCQTNRNVVFAIPGGWSSACTLGVPGDWQTHLVYRSAACNGQAFCVGTNADCPCNNGGLPTTGCDIAQGTGGVEMTMTNVVPNGDGTGTGDITGTGFPATTSPAVITIRNTSPQIFPPAFGDGILCVGAAGVVRFGAGFAQNGTYQTSFSHGAMAGQGTFYYQLWFRNTPVMFCDPAAAFNLSNGWELTWP